MKKSILLAAVLAAVSSVAQADNTQTQKAVPVPPLKATKPVEQKAIKAVRLSDAELDKITAGASDGLTFIFNPGNANVLKFNRRNFVCINCF